MVAHIASFQYFAENHFFRIFTTAENGTDYGVSKLRYEKQTVAESMSRHRLANCVQRHWELRGSKTAVPVGANLIALAAFRDKELNASYDRSDRRRRNSILTTA